MPRTLVAARIVATSRELLTETYPTSLGISWMVSCLGVKVVLMSMFNLFLFCLSVEATVCLTVYVVGCACTAEWDDFLAAVNSISTILKEDLIQTVSSILSIEGLSKCLCLIDPVPVVEHVHSSMTDRKVRNRSVQRCWFRTPGSRNTANPIDGSELRGRGRLRQRCDENLDCFRFDTLSWFSVGPKRHSYSSLLVFVGYAVRSL